MDGRKTLEVLSLPSKIYKKNGSVLSHTVPVAIDSTHSFMAGCSDEVMWPTVWCIFGTADSIPRVTPEEVLACAPCTKFGEPQEAFQKA